MTGTFDPLLATRLARTLFPEWEGVGVEHSIQEHILADALAASPPPRTLRELLLVLERHAQKRGSVALVTLVALRSLTLETLDLSLEEFAR